MPQAKKGSDTQNLAPRIWDKDPTLWKSDAVHRKIIENSLGWLKLPAVMPERLAELESFLKDVKKHGIMHVVVLGMGGSSLAPEVLRRTFPKTPGYLALHVLDSTDPEAVADLEAHAPPAKTLYLVASKSGGTVEPNRMLDYFYAKVKKVEGDKVGRHFAAITDPDSPLTKKAAKMGFCKTFLNFADIGGRYSALSCFGLVPAALAGIDVAEMLKRAAAMADACAKKGEDNPGWSLGEELGRHAAAGRDKLTFLVSPEIASFGLWLEQLIAESTGKEGKGMVPISGEPASKPQNYGGDRVFVHVQLKRTKFKALAEQAKRLRSKGLPVITLELEDRLALGAEFFRWEFATAVLGHFMKIDPFDQPDVQAAKEKTNALLAALEAGGSLPAVEAHLTEDGMDLTFSGASKPAGEEGSLDEALARFFADAKKGNYAGALAYLHPGGKYNETFEELKEALVKRGRMAVQSGYGPRYLHSTGQLHKGGADNGLFLLMSHIEGAKLKIPGQEYGFEDLVRAQALGDFQALDAAGRRAVLIRMRGNPKKALKRLAQGLGAESAVGAY